MKFFLELNPLFYICILFIIVIYLLIMNFVQSSKLKRLKKRYDKFMKGKNAEDLDQLIHEMLDRMEELELIHHKSMIKIEDGFNHIGSTYKKMGVIKYDAFKEMGGNLSFALCLLNSDNNGFILNTMHGRESSYTYVKEIVKGEAYATLGEEEKEALDKALNS